MAGPLYYGVEQADRRTLNQLLDWWTRQAGGAPPGSTVSRGDAVPVMILQAPDGWTGGWYSPLGFDARYPWTYDVCLIGYPMAYELGMTEPGTFRVAWNGIESQPIAFDATADQFRAALPKSLRDVCKVTGGSVLHTINGQVTRLNPGRWFVSLPEPATGLTAVELTAGLTDAVVLRVEQSPLPYSAGGFALPCSTIVGRSTAPRVAVGSLALGWYTQGFGLVIGVIEPRIYEAYTRRLTIPTTTTTAAGTTTTAAPTTTTTGGPTTTGEPTTTTTSSEPTTTTTPAPTTTSTTTTTPFVDPETTTTSAAPTTTSFAPTTTTTEMPEFTTTASP